MSVKTYVLLDALNSSAPIYQHVGDGKRVQLTKIQNWSPYLRITFQDKDGKTKTIRYKEGLPTIDQTKQIKEFETPANIGWTTRERSDMVFKLGTLTTNKPNVQNYLENYPAFDKFEGFSDDHRTPCYKLLDLEADSKVLNTEIRTRVKAANKVLDMSLEGKQELLLRLNGSFFTPPKEDIDCENMLMEIIDDMDESGLKEVLRNELTADESVSILIGKLLNAGELSFNKNPNQISKKVKGNWVDVKAISSDYTPEERKRYFIEFLTSDSGEALLADLRKSEADLPKSEVKEPVKGTAPVIDPPAPTELEKAEMLLKEALDSGANEKTVEKFQKAVDELKSNS
ncbi:MAG TPA: hypothetical protein VIQ23_13690 [Hanamia sp.]